MSCPECKEVSTYAEWEDGYEGFKKHPEYRGIIFPFRSAIVCRTSHFECLKCKKMIHGDRLDKE